MAEARRRIDQALQRGEPIAVHGDYDADGITATFLLVGVLGELGADVRWRLPNRFSDGYGVSAAAVDELAAAGVKLLITVDCGINARAEVAQAQALGHGRHRHRPPRARGRPARLHRRHPQARRVSRAATSPASAWPSSWRTRCWRIPATSSSTCRWRCARTPTSWPSAPSPTWSRWWRRTGCSPPSASAGCAARRGRGWRRCSRSPAAGRERPTPGPWAFAWGRGSTRPAASRTRPSRSSCSAAPTATPRCRSRSSSTSSTASGRPSRRRCSRRRWPWCPTRRRRRSCCRRPSGTRASSASSRRAWPSASTARPSCSARATTRPRGPGAASPRSTCSAPSNAPPTTC